MKPGSVRLPARVAGIGVVVGLCTAGLVTLAAPAASASTTTTIGTTSWAYVDSADPHTSFADPAGNAPVGTTTDASGVSHTTKSYVTFDLTPFRGNRLTQAEMFTDEKTVADCSTPRDTQVWLTAPAPHNPTWASQPDELAQLPGPGSLDVCPSDRVEWDATQAIQAALNAGRSTATFVLRLPDAEQADPAYTRSYDPAVRITITYNHAPGTPTQLSVNGTACTAKPLLEGLSITETLAATVSDADNDWLTEQFVWWPADHPDQRTEIDVSDGYPSSFPVKAGIQQAQLADATTYAWQVRSQDSLDTGPWSAICTFTTDFSAPAPPTVSSTDYPDDGAWHGGSGVPGAFILSANGVADVTGFYYGTDEPGTFVPADHRGGSATIQLTPSQIGPSELTVQSVDAAGNRSAITRYEYLVANNEPNVSCTPVSGYLGVPRQCTFTPASTNVVGVVGYVYQFDQGATETVPAGADGSATVSVTPTGQYGSTLAVQARLSNGNLTAANDALIQTDPGTPLVDQSADEVVEGMPVRFTFHAVLPGSTNFTYLWQGGAPVTVPVGADGTATVSLTPTTSGFAELDVYTTTDTGLQSGTASAYLTVDSNMPTVTSTDYPEYASSGGVGEPGTFTFSSPVAGVVGYTYTFNDNAPVTVPAGPDGTATVVLTPTTAYAQNLVVTSTLADGSTSEQNDYYFLANPVASTMDGIDPATIAR